MNWQLIESALDGLPFQVLGQPKPFKSYAPALVYGRTWQGDGSFLDDYPEDGRGDWSGEPRVAIASTYEGQGFWTVLTDAPNEYEVYIQPSHWMPLPPPPGDE